MNGNKITSALHNIVFRTCYAFTLLVLIFSSITYISVSEGNENLIPSLTMLFCILLFSFIYALSFLTFNAKKLGDAPKRIIHIILNYINLWISFFLIAGKVKDIKAFIISSFIYIIVYTIITGLNVIIKKVKGKLA
ncbi:MAG: hypothetical protein A2Y17_03675 [Clostridiales bacterium GWF2_38_85]|nr:MAG: hypothetical protein A2Y17_03675 [Clostridiales bacterium GWF2_38_85]HBL85308.1 hypothetical protein [Clostridiales bacterium]